MQKRFIEEQDLLEDSYRLAVKIYQSGFRPDYMAGLWRGGSAVGIYVQECLQYLGIETDHIAIRTSYSGHDDYFRQLEQDEQPRAHGLQYIVENLGDGDSLLLVDDVYSTGRNVRALVESLRKQTRRNMINDVRIATLYYRASGIDPIKPPDYFLHRTEDWLVLPYELTDVSRAEMVAHKPWIVPLLDELKPGWS